MNGFFWLLFLFSNSHCFQDYPHIKAIFLVGRPSPTNKSQAFQRHLEKEHAAHCDLLQFDYIEHYNNNTLKQLHAMQYLYQKFGRANGTFEYVLRVDDDVFLNIPLLDKLFFLKSSQRLVYQSYYLSCCSDLIEYTYQKTSVFF